MAHDDEIVTGLEHINSEFKKIELELKKQELDIMKENEKQKKRVIAGLIAGAVLVTVLIVVVVHMWSKKEAQKLAVAQEEQFQNQMQKLYDVGITHMEAEEYSSAIDIFSQITLEADCYEKAIWQKLIQTK